MGSRLMACSYFLILSFSTVSIFLMCYFIYVSSYIPSKKKLLAQDLSRNRCPSVSFQRTDQDSVIGVSPAVMIRSSSQDSEVSTVVGEYHIGLCVGGAWISREGLLPFEGCSQS